MPLIRGGISWRIPARRTCRLRVFLVRKGRGQRVGRLGGWGYKSEDGMCCYKYLPFDSCGICLTCASISGRVSFYAPPQTPPRYSLSLSLFFLPLSLFFSSVLPPRQTQCRTCENLLGQVRIEMHFDVVPGLSCFTTADQICSPQHNHGKCITAN